MTSVVATPIANPMSQPSIQLSGIVGVGVVVPPHVSAWLDGLVVEGLAVVLGGDGWSGLPAVTVTDAAGAGVAGRGGDGHGVSRLRSQRPAHPK